MLLRQYVGQPDTTSWSYVVQFCKFAMLVANSGDDS